jgi:hypothetical protein
MLAEWVQAARAMGQPAEAVTVRAMQVQREPMQVEPVARVIPEAVAVLTVRATPLQQGRILAERVVAARAVGQPAQALTAQATLVQREPTLVERVQAARVTPVRQGRTSAEQRVQAVWELP